MSTTLERLQKLFITRFHYNIERLTATTSLENLGLDSLNLIDFLILIENEFKITIPDEGFDARKIRTIQDIVDGVDRYLSEQTVHLTRD